MAAVAAAPQGKTVEEIIAENQQFAQAERQFQEVLLELESDDTLEVFRREYEALHNSFIKCHDGEKRLIKKCMDLMADAKLRSQKVVAAEELASGDRQTIEQLAKEIERTAQRHHLLRETEQSLKEQVKQLRSTVHELEEKVSRGVVGARGKDHDIEQLSRLLDNLQRDCSTHEAALSTTTTEIDQLRRHVADVRKEVFQKEDELRRLRDAARQKQAEVGEQQEKTANKEASLRLLREQLSMRNKGLHDSMAEVDSVRRNVEELKRVHETARQAQESDNKQLNITGREAQHLRQALEEHTESNDQLAKDIQSVASQLKQRNAEVAQVHKLYLKQEHALEAATRRNTNAELQRAEAKDFLERVKTNLRNAQQENAHVQELAECDRKQLINLSRERDILDNKLLQVQTRSKQQDEWRDVCDNQVRSAEHQLKRYEAHFRTLQEHQHRLVEEAEQYETELNRLTAKYAAVSDDVEKLDVQITEEQERIADAETRVKNQQTMLDAVLDERNVHTKHLNELRSDIGEMGRTFKSMLSQIRQLKEEIQQKERELVAEESVIAALTTLRRQHEIEIATCKKKWEKRERLVEAFSIEVHKLRRIAADAEAERNRQQRDLDSLLHERDMLSTQLLHRNTELSTLYEKIRVQRSLLHRGEAQYRDRLSEVHGLQNTLDALSLSLRDVKAYTSRLPMLQKALSRAQSALSTVMEQETALWAEGRQNVHCQRLRAAVDPRLSPLQRVVRSLQSKLGGGVEKLSGINAAIEAGDQQVAALRKLMQRQWGGVRGGAFETKPSGQREPVFRSGSSARVGPSTESAVDESGGVAAGTGVSEKSGFSADGVWDGKDGLRPKGSAETETSSAGEVDREATLDGAQSDRRRLRFTSPKAGEAERARVPFFRPAGIERTAENEIAALRSARSNVEDAEKQRQVSASALATLRQVETQVALQRSRVEELREELREMTEAFLREKEQKWRQGWRSENDFSFERDASATADEVYVGYTAPPRPPSQQEE